MDHELVRALTPIVCAAHRDFDHATAVARAERLAETGAYMLTDGRVHGAGDSLACATATRLDPATALRLVELAYPLPPNADRWTKAHCTLARWVCLGIDITTGDLWAPEGARRAQAR